MNLSIQQQIEDFCDYFMLDIISIEDIWSKGLGEPDVYVRVEPIPNSPFWNNDYPNAVYNINCLFSNGRLYMQLEDLWDEDYTDVEQLTDDLYNNFISDGWEYDYDKGNWE